MAASLPHAASRTSRAERTRAAILDEAERLFAEGGFDGTRLADVAAAVGIQRASIVYHFKDKRELYDAVLADVLSGFRERLEAALAEAGTLLERIEAGVGAWVDYVGSRPSMARLLLREIAGASVAAPPALLAQIQPFVDVVERFRHGVREDPLVHDRGQDAVHVASAIVGTTLFFVAGMPILVPDKAFDPLAPAQLAAHREEVLRITRHLLGANEPNTRNPEEHAHE
jgi:AcrR family transcriptional regulator